jgi:hypothetical protein
MRSIVIRPVSMVEFTIGQCATGPLKVCEEGLSPLIFFATVVRKAGVKQGAAGSGHVAA